MCHEGERERLKRDRESLGEEEEKEKISEQMGEREKKRCWRTL